MGMDHRRNRRRARRRRRVYYLIRRRRKVPRRHRRRRCPTLETQARSRAPRGTPRRRAGDGGSPRAPRSAGRSARRADRRARRSRSRRPRPKNSPDSDSGNAELLLHQLGVLGGSKCADTTASNAFGPSISTITRSICSAIVFSRSRSNSSDSVTWRRGLPVLRPRDPHAKDNRPVPARSPRVVLAAPPPPRRRSRSSPSAFRAIGTRPTGPYGLSLPELGAMLSRASRLRVRADRRGIAVDRFGADGDLRGHGLAPPGSPPRPAESKGLLFARSRLGDRVRGVPIAGAGALFRVYPAARRGWALGIRQTAVPLGGTTAALRCRCSSGRRYPLAVAVAAASGRSPERVRRWREERSGRRAEPASGSLPQIVRARGCSGSSSSLALTSSSCKAISPTPCPRPATRRLSRSPGGYLLRRERHGDGARLVWGGSPTGRADEARAHTRRDRARRRRRLLSSRSRSTPARSRRVPSSRPFGFGAFGWNAHRLRQSPANVPPGAGGTFGRAA